MEFTSVIILRNTIKEYFIHVDREYVLRVNDAHRVRVKCRGEGCEWMMFALVHGGRDSCTFKVKTLIDKHTCGLVFNNIHVNTTWLAKHFLDHFRLNPSMTYAAYKEITTKIKFAQVSSWSFVRAKTKARKILQGSIGEQSILDEYYKMLLSTNRGSTTKIITSVVDGKRTFQRVYICLKACKDGWIRGCKPLIGLDGCFLKGYCKGMLLAVVGIDGDNSMFPIAFAVVEKENTEVWKWFMELLKSDLLIEDTKKITMMSDRQKSLEIASGELFNGSEERFCVRHLHSNFKKDYLGLLLKQLLRAAACSTTLPQFDKAMKELKNVNEGAYNSLSDKTPSEWTKSHMSEYPKCDMLLNNLCESFNAAIIDARDKPIIMLLEKIRFWLMSHFYKKKQAMEKWTQPVGKSILKILEKNKQVAKNFLVTRAKNYTFKVTISSIINGLRDQKVYM
ncbi:uncharacterized protein LOC133795950 [Humulus lupulus]|uniref:uncharacterized protein LOC133795950 n=1 Tax=Humulus lupulus TaxID=3486 RepID=UPI002B408FB6|nr:uncharacterized protein LOC133795950 [Humulus lupulus]